MVLSFHKNKTEDLNRQNSVNNKLYLKEMLSYLYDSFMCPIILTQQDLAGVVGRIMIVEPF